MQLLDRLTSSGYSYISPSVDRACIVVPMLGGIKERIEPYAPPLIQKADMCIDTVYGVVEVRATALHSAANSAGNKALRMRDEACRAVEEGALALREVGGRAQKMIGESVVVVRVHKTSLAIVDTLDMLIDRYLPDPAKDETRCEKQSNLIPRVLYFPFKIPVRMMHISLAKARNGRDVIQVRIHWASQLILDQKATLQAFILSKAQTVTDGASDILVSMSHRSYYVASFVVGQDRATDIFKLFGKMLPTSKIAIDASASTGALPDTPSHEDGLEVEPKVESSTGTAEIVKASVFPGPTSFTTTSSAATSLQDEKVMSITTNRQVSEENWNFLE